MFDSEKSQKNIEEYKQYISNKAANIKSKRKISHLENVSEESPLYASRSESNYINDKVRCGGKISMEIKGEFGGNEPPKTEISLNGNVSDKYGNSFKTSVSRHDNGKIYTSTILERDFDRGYYNEREHERDRNRD